MHVKKKWGCFKQLVFNQPCSVKIIEINPGQQTSFHYHNMRDDLWFVLDDGLAVQIGDKLIEAKKDQEFVVPAGTPHRLVSKSKKPVRVLEIAFGYTDESDKFKAS